MKIARKIFFVNFILLHFNSTAQQSILLNTAEAGFQSHVACKNIDLNPGYFYEALGLSMECYINPNGICGIEYLSQEYNPSNLGTINTDLPVGSTLGNIDVSATGACVYTIPLLAPPGTLGIEPNLYITYNSQNQNSTMGVGWSLSGNCISSISRVGQNYYFDQTISAVQIDNSDRFILDGARLIPPTASENGLDNIVYKTEIENHSIITSHGQSGSGPAYFEVVNKDRVTYQYGYSSDAFFEAQGTTTAIMWLLNKITDRNGNYISMFYFKDASTGKIRIDRILYTGNDAAGISPYNEVKFIYGVRNDKNLHYLNGYKIENNILLTSIQFYSENFVSRKYDFIYSENPSAGAHLSEIYETGVDNKKYNPIKIGWSKSENTNYLNPDLHSGETDLDKVPDHSIAHLKTPGDFNGDGFTDFFVNHLLTNSPYNNGRGVELYLNDEGNGYPQPTSTGAMPSSYRKTIRNYGDAKRREFVSDFDGDGDDDIVYYGINSSDNLCFNVRWNGSSNTSEDGQEFEPSVGNDATSTNDGNGIIKPDYGFYTLIGDFSGDGINELFIYFYDLDTWYIHDFYNHGLTVSQGVDWGDYRLSFNTLDFDGDGKDEIMFTYPNSGTNDYHYVLKLNSQNHTLYTLSHGSWPNSCEGNDGVTYSADFNGDGRTDLLTWNGCSNGWSIGYSIRTSDPNFPIQFQEFSAPFTESDPRTNDSYECFVADFNGDTKSDIALFYHYYNSTSQIWEKYVNVYYSRGNNEFYLEVVSFSSNTIPAGKANVGDFNDDGHADIIYEEATTHELHGIYFKNSGVLNVEDYNKVTSITNGFGETIFIDYNTLPRLSSSGCYFNTGSNNSPINVFQGSLSVVQKIKNINGIGGYSNTEYKYYDAKYHTTRNSFIGFEKIVSENDVSEIRTELDFEINWAGIPFLNLQSNYYKGVLIDSKETNFYLSATPDLRFIMELRRLTEKDHVTGNSVVTDFEYDNDGNIEHQIININGGQQIIDIVNSYISITPSSILSKLSTSTIVTTKQLQTSTDIMHFEYNVNGFLTDKYDHYQSNRQVLTHYEYNGNNAFIGVPNSVEISSNGVQSRNKLFIYDSNFRYIIAENNGLSQVVETSYDGRFGIPKQAKGVDGLITRIEYDGFGRKIKTTTPDNLSSSVRLNWCLPGTLALDDPLTINSNIIYSSTIETSGRPDSKFYYDILGREVLTETDGFDGKLYKQISFYGNGLPQSETGTFKQGSNNVLITTKLYQGSNHPTDLISINESHGGNTRTTYFDYDYSAGNGVYTITVTDPAGNETSKTTDGLGNLISATDDGGAISYEYNNRNQIKEIRVNGDVAATMTYDNYGFQNSLNDRDAGLIVYEYNNFNQLKTQTDARQSVTTIDYNDPLGRITSKTVNSGSSNYVYSYAYVQTGNNGVNQLQNVSVTGPSGTFSEINTYDYLGRILSFEQVSDGQALTTNCSYDVSNNIETTTFPGGFKIKNEYTNKGFLKKILNLENNFLIWETVETNDFGQIREYKQGFQPMTSIIEYDHFGYAKRFFTPGVQDLNMEFNLQSGNLNWREDLSNGRNLKEEFTYGVLDRLESSTVTSPVVLPHVSVSYNTTNGSIVSKSDAGSFSDYSVAHKNAVENIYGFTSNIPVQQQDLTYTPFNKVKTIEEGDNALVLKYGQDDQRKVVDFYNQGNLIHKRYYHPNYEKEIVGNLTREINYIQGPNGICAMHIVENGVANTHYVFKDHLGSVLKLTDEYGSVIAEQNFDAWGRKRNPADWTYSSVTSSPLLYRGFTGHEHLPQFNLINMNGRMYDPVLGLMLSPDNFVQEHRTLNYNRYSYCVNNPLKYVDKDGNYFIIDDIAAMAIGGGMNLYNAFQAGKVHSFWEGAAYFSAGAIGAEVGLYAGPAAGFAVGGLLTVGADFGFGNVATDNKGNIKIGGLVSSFISGGSSSVVGSSIGRNIADKIRERKRYVQPTKPKVIKETPKPNSERSITEETKLELDNNSYSLTTYKEYKPQQLDAQSFQIGPPRPEISDYHPSLADKTDIYHNFPKKYDQVIINEGAWSQRISDHVRYNNTGYMFEAPGTINGVNGTFQIGVNGQGVVFHKFFLPY